MFKLEPDEHQVRRLYKELQREREFPSKGILGKLQNTNKH